MTWTVERTDTFLEALKEHKKNQELLNALDKKIVRLQEDPTTVGGRLSGKLHGCSPRGLFGSSGFSSKLMRNHKQHF
jgi:hypothetical protein